MSNIFKLSNIKFKERIKDIYVKYRLPSFNNKYYLIKWLPNVETDYHGHLGKECKYILLKGSYLFEERCKNKLSEITYQKVKPFKVYHINDKKGIHKMINSEDKIKWSIHRYS
tara:strand:- start:64 stop:402 length:339 start_codon:yes stop_codon:yes gene_type:complete